MTKNDYAWEKIFNDFDIVKKIDSSDFYKISASTIKKATGREARLMTKFDHKLNLPALFKKHNLAILPITRGDYLIGRFEAYKKIEINTIPEIMNMELPAHIQSINYENINSESIAINCAYNSGILSNFLEEEDLLPTIYGRMSSGGFSFRINSIIEDTFMNISVSKAQVEIDGGFEGVNSLSLIEAKNSLSSDFLIRQLYYPFALWSGKVSKSINSIFLTYSNGIYDLYLYDFEDIANYNSLKLIKHARYSIEPRDIELEDIQDILKNVKAIHEPYIPFPQADSFERVINLCELLYQKNELSRFEVTSNYDFDVRQTNYYSDAGRYLGLISKTRYNDEIKYSLTKLGKTVFNMSLRKRQLMFVELILKHDVFKKVLLLYLKKAKPPTKDEIYVIMKSSKLYNIDAVSTLKRRVRTVKSWIDWILGLLT